MNNVRVFRRYKNSDNWFTQYHPNGEKYRVSLEALTGLAKIYKSLYMVLIIDHNGRDITNEVLK